MKEPNGSLDAVFTLLLAVMVMGFTYLIVMGEAEDFHIGPGIETEP